MLEQWVIDLLNDISESAQKGENFDLHLEAKYAQEIAKQYKDSRWIEIY